MLTTYSYNAEAENYWKLLKNASSEVKLRLITLLSESIMKDVEDDRSNILKKIESGSIVNKFAGTWKGNDSAEDIIMHIREGRSCRNPISFENWVSR